MYKMSFSGLKTFTNVKHINDIQKILHIFKNYFVSHAYILQQHKKLCTLTTTTKKHPEAKVVEKQKLS